jgi:hypothetical protein
VAVRRAEFCANKICNQLGAIRILLAYIRRILDDQPE